MRKFFTRDRIMELLQITIGVFLMTAGFYFFLSPCQLVGGGVTGLAIIFDFSFGLSETVMVYVLNIICLLLGLIFLGKSFFFKTVYSTLLSPTFMAIFELFRIPNELIYNQISSNNQLLVVTIFGAVLSGVGIGLVIRNGATTGGMDVPERIVSKKLHLPFSYVMYAMDGAIIIAGFAFFGIEKGIFAVICLFFTGYLIDVFSVGGSSKRAFYIITEEEDKIIEAIFTKINRGATIVDVIGGYTRDKKRMVICILNKGQYAHLRSLVNSIDPKAFIYITKANEVIGEGFTKEERENTEGGLLNEKRID